MAWIISGRTYWKGDLGGGIGHETPSIVNPQSWAWRTGLGTALTPYTDAIFAFWQLVYMEPISDVAPGVGANMDLRAVFYFRNETLERVQTFSLPAPKSSIYETTPAGVRIKATPLIEVVAFLASAMGQTLTPLYGVIVQRG